MSERSFWARSSRLCSRAKRGSWGSFLGAKKNATNIADGADAVLCARERFTPTYSDLPSWDRFRVVDPIDVAAHPIAIFALATPRIARGQAHPWLRQALIETRRPRRANFPVFTKAKPTRCHRHWRLRNRGELTGRNPRWRVEIAFLRIGVPRLLNASDKSRSTRRVGCSPHRAVEDCSI